MTSPRRAARRRRPPAATTPPPPTPGNIKTLADLLAAFLPTVAESTHPAFRSTLCQAAQVCTGRADLENLPLKEVRGLPQTWDEYLARQQADDQLTPGAVVQYRSRIQRLVRWAMEDLFPRSPLELRNWLLDLSQFDTHRHGLLRLVKQDKGMPCCTALRYFFQFMDQSHHSLADLETHGYHIMETYAHHLEQRGLQKATYRPYLNNLGHALQFLQGKNLLPVFELYKLSPPSAYHLPWDRWPNQDLKAAVRFFIDHACPHSFLHDKEWPWDPVKPKTRDQIVQVVERFIGFLVHHYPGGGLDLGTLTPDQIFSRKHLSAFREFYLGRNGAQPNRGLTSTFESLLTFAYRVLKLDPERFDRLYDPQTPARPRLEQQRTLPEWLAILAAVQEDIAATTAPRKKLGLQRFEFYLQLLIASLQRPLALAQVHPEHLVEEGETLVLLVPPEHQKKKRHLQPQWERIPLPKTFAAEWDQYRKRVLPAILGKQPSPFVFPLFPPKKDHVNTSTITTQIKYYDQKAHGVPREHTTSAHTIRKTAVTTMIRHEDKKGAFMASRVLGHTSTKTTRKYYLDGKGSQLIHRDWRIHELLSQKPLTDQHLSDAVELVHRDETEWQLLKQGLAEMASTHPTPSARLAD